MFFIARYIPGNGPIYRILKNTLFRKGELGPPGGKLQLQQVFLYFFLFFRSRKNWMPPPLLASLLWTRCKVHARDTLDNNALWKSKSSARAEAAFAEVTQGQSVRMSPQLFICATRVVNALLLSAKQHLPPPAVSPDIPPSRLLLVPAPASAGCQQPLSVAEHFLSFVTVTFHPPHLSSPTSGGIPYSLALSATSIRQPHTFSRTEAITGFLIWKIYSRVPIIEYYRRPVSGKHGGPISSHREHVEKLPAGK